MVAITTPNNFGANHPAWGQDAYNVTPSDTVIQNFMTLWVGGAGNVVITTFSGNLVTFTSVPAGAELHVSGQKVMANGSGTTATNIVAYT